MKANKLTVFNQKKTSAFMDEKTEMQGENEKAILATVHEIRNPLTSIKLTQQVIQEIIDSGKIDTSVLQSHMKMIATNVERIEKYLYEALGKRKKENKLEPVNICDCIDKALCEAKDRLYLSNIKVSNYKGMHWVYGNEEKLVTAFLNIIINSIEAIKGNNGMIWVSVYKTNNAVRITFKDNGIGMSASTANKIFDPDFSTKDGIGIGLFTVKQIIEQHKAHIVVDSMQGVGTSISILFNSFPGEEVLEKFKRDDSPLHDR